MYSVILENNTLRGFCEILSSKIPFLYCEEKVSELGVLQEQMHSRCWGPLCHPSPNISVMGGQTRVALIASDLMKLTDQAAFTSKGRKF